MPQVSAAVLRSTPSSTSASASIRRAAALFSSPLAALRSSQAVRSSRVIDTAAPIDAAPLKSQHRVRVSLIWESLMSHSFGPLVSPVPSIDRRHRQLRQLDAVDAADVYRDHLGAVRLAAAGKHFDAAIDAELMADRVLVEQVFLQVLLAGAEL